MGLFILGVIHSTSFPGLQVRKLRFREVRMRIRMIAIIATWILNTALTVIPLILTTALSSALWWLSFYRLAPWSP